MKNMILILLLASGLFACKDDDSIGFDIPVSDRIIRAVEPRPGGALIRYDLPDNSDVFALNVRYVDAQGQETLKVGGYGTDSLLLDGFTRAQEEIHARVSLVNHRNEESESFPLTFQTEHSASYALFDGIDVSPYWDGFQVIYEAPEVVAGMVHVFYEGINPVTKLSDTILLKSYPISKGGDTLMFQLQQPSERNTVIIRTEDYSGRRVRQEVYPGVESYIMEKLQLTANDFYDPFKLSISGDNDKSGIEYLFDGDTKGTLRMKEGETKLVYTFLAGPSAVGKPFVVDLKGDKVPASVRIYCILYNNLGFTSTYSTGSDLGYIWQARNYTKLPCKVTVYGGNDKDGEDASWTRLSSFSQSPNLSVYDRWCYAATSGTEYKTIEALEDADPTYLEVLIPASETKYKYLKIVVNDTFRGLNTAGDQNANQYVTMHELEVFVKK